MKFKNKDGTVNSLPIVLIFTVFAVALHILVFGFDFKKTVAPIVGDVITTKKTSVETTTIKVCNGCSMRFLNNSIDVSTNGEVDIATLMYFDKVSIRNVSFSSSDTNVFSIVPQSGTFKIATGNMEGSAILEAKYADIDITLVVNVVHPSKSEVKFKYPYYFCAVKEKITPEIETYPYGYNTDGMEFSTAQKGFVTTSKKSASISCKKAGSDTLSLSVGNNKSSTTIYVVPNLITVKVSEGGSYKAAREITPAGNSFDIVVQFEDKNKDNFDNKNLSITFDNQGLIANATYVSKHSDINSYKYHIELSGVGKSVMRVELGDGSFTLFEINK